MRPTPHPLLATLLAISLAACSTAPAQPSGNSGTLTPVGAAFNIRFTGLGTANFDASITTPTSSNTASSGLARTQMLSDQQASVRPVRVIARGSLDVIPSTGPRTNGFRYVYAVVSVTSTSALSNVSFLGVRTSNARPATGGNDTAISDAIRAPGGAAYSDAALLSLVLSVKPAQASTIDPTTNRVTPLPNTEDTVQYLPESALSFVPAGMVGLLPYGFTVLNGSGGRTLSTALEANRMIVGMKVPLAAVATDDPYAFSFAAVPVSDSETRVTQSLEAQSASGNAAVTARAAALGAGTTITVLPSVFAIPRSGSNSSVALCSVRTAGNAMSPTAYLINRVPTSVALSVITKDQTLPLQVTGTDANGSFNLSAQVTLANPSLATISASQITALSAGETTVTATACGVTSSGAFNVLKAETMSAEYFYSLALKSDGTVSAWGNNNYQQLNVPNGLSNVIAISAGAHYSLALKSDGTVSAWGSNASGQLIVPNGLTNVVAISAGAYHSLALKRDGTVSAWGSNASGQLIVPNGLTNVAAISAGGYHSLALKSDGTVSAWGSNASGQLIVPVIAPLTFKLP